MLLLVVLIVECLHFVTTHGTKLWLPPVVVYQAAYIHQRSYLGWYCVDCRVMIKHLVYILLAGALAPP